MLREKQPAHHNHIKDIMRYFILFLLSTCLMAAEAVSLDGLSVEQANAIRAIAAQKNTAVVVREETEAWVKIGQNVGSAMLGAAKEIGVAAVDFAKTPLGTMVCILIVFKMFGTFIFATLIGISIFTFGVYALWYGQKRIISKPIFKQVPVLWGFWTVNKVEKYEDARASEAITGFVCVLPVIAMIVGLIFIGVGIAHI
jgi:hypothetical protein